MSRVEKLRFAFWLMLAVIGWTLMAGQGAEPSPPPQTLSTNATNDALRQSVRAEQIRNACIEGRRIICGRVLQVTTNGVVVDSGYRQLLDPPLNHDWVAPKTAVLSRDAHAVEEQKPGAVCIGIVFLSNIPKRPKVGLYDYVALHGYPAGYHTYVPVPGIEKKIRRFSASLERACEANAAESGKLATAENHQDR
ncbi:MAG TPA: hypothetical protein VFE51_07845 [Verrucomicrobiae bacterium]|nr:hypothetical protein [Verrucomicrobiae bacterium]